MKISQYKSNPKHKNKTNSLLKAINGVVLSRHAEYIDICIHGEVYKNTTWVGKFRLDSQVNEVAYQRMFAALDSFVSPLLSPSSSSSSSSSSSTSSSTSKHSEQHQSKLSVALRNLLLYTYPHCILNNAAASTEQRNTPSLPIQSIGSSSSNRAKTTELASSSNESNITTTSTASTSSDTQKTDTIQPGMYTASPYYYYLLYHYTILLYTTTIIYYTTKLYYYSMYYTIIILLY